jgi:hypothetical protein
MKTKFIRRLLPGVLSAVAVSLAMVAPAQQLDFGDAPAPYPTLLNHNGARHAMGELRLGNFIDGEPDGQPNPTATGDDINPVGAPDDEDGVVFMTAMVPGQVATVRVTASGRGRLDAWIDFNANGSWADTGEKIFNSVLIDAGDTLLDFTVPPNAAVQTTFARFRFSQQGGLGFVGFAPDGEVEDYQVAISSPDQPMDFGDAPDPSYPTLLRNDGARHVILQGFHLGARVDAEPDGQPNSTATGDDINPTSAPSDEDGVVFLTPLVPGQSALVEVTASATGGFLSAWIDFDGNGSWADAGDQIIADVGLVPGANNINFIVPPNARPGTTHARFRFSRQTKLSFDGPAPDGEVEDYQVSIVPNRERCDLGCRGREFWLAFPGNYAPDPNRPVQLSVNIVGPVNTAVMVAIPGLGFTTNIVIPASMTYSIALPSAADLANANDIVTAKGIHVTASAEIGVFGFNHVRHTTDSFLALPADVLGKEYIVLGWPNVHSGVSELNGSQFAIVASEDETIVTITPSMTTGARPAGVPYDITLNAGDTYQLRNTNNAPGDLSGTIIMADKPIGVFGSHQCANVPSSAVWFCDYIVEQLLPVNTWGSEFYTVPLATRTAPDTYRVIAAEDATTVSFNGIPFTSLNRGESAQFGFGLATHVSADKPVLLAQYANSSDRDGVVHSDPFMAIVQATRHYANQYATWTPTYDFPTNYLNIVAPNGAVGSILLDAVAIPAGAFTAIGASGYSFARVTVTPGLHFLSGSAPFGVTVYGWAEYDSYGHPGCFFVGDVQPPRIQCIETNIVVTVGQSPTAPCTASIPDLREGLDADDNCTPRQSIRITQTPAPGTLVGPGVHTIVVSATDNAGNTSRCPVTFTVIDASLVSIVCPPDMFVQCTSSQGAIVQYQATARSACGSDLPVQCSPPSGSLFPPGTTTVICEVPNAAGQTTNCTFTVTVRCAGTVTATLTPGNTLTVTWTGSSGTLEAAPAVTGPWREVTNGVNSAVVQISEKTGFFRVRH